MPEQKFDFTAAAEAARTRALNVSRAVWLRELEVIDRRVAREVAREEIASFCGFALRRIRETHPLPADLGTKTAAFVWLRDALAAIFEEALSDFGATEDEPGEG